MPACSEVARELGIAGHAACWAHVRRKFVEAAAGRVGVSLRGGCFCNPGAAEICNSVDDNCSTVQDDGDITAMGLGNMLDNGQPESGSLGFFAYILCPVERFKDLGLVLQRDAAAGILHPEYDQFVILLSLVQQSQHPDNFCFNHAPTANCRPQYEDIKWIAISSLLKR